MNTNNSEFTRLVGKRVELALCVHASGEEIKKAAAFNEMLQAAFPFGKKYVCAKGIYRFKTHEEANFHQEQCIAETMALVSRLNNLRNNS
jgi:hypothetical protein